MTKEQFLKTYGQPNTVVSFKNDAEKMEFLKECYKFDIPASYKTKECIMNRECCINISTGVVQYSGCDWYEYNDYVIIGFKTPSPKSLIKDGWMGVTREGRKVYFIKSLNVYVKDSKLVWEIDKFYDDMLLFDTCKLSDIMELYDNLGNLQWKREEKSQKNIEIERIESEIRTSSEEYAKTVSKLMDDLSKLKGE